VETAKAEVQRLLDATFIREFTYPAWLANVVMVRKNRKWRMYTDFTYLSKCCLKDDFHLIMIDKIIDLVVGYEMVTLLDCLLGCHQICLHKEEKTHTLKNILLYVNAEGLKFLHGITTTNYVCRTDEGCIINI
jgi:hypothetical protein